MTKIKQYSIYATVITITLVGFVIIGISLYAVWDARDVGCFNRSWSVDSINYNHLRCGDSFLEYLFKL